MDVDVPARRIVTQGPLRRRQRTTNTAGWRFYTRTELRLCPEATVPEALPDVVLPPLSDARSTKRWATPRRVVVHPAPSVAVAPRPPPSTTRRATHRPRAAGVVVSARAPPTQRSPLGYARARHNPPVALRPLRAVDAPVDAAAPATTPAEPSSPSRGRQGPPRVLRIGLELRRCVDDLLAVAPLREGERLFIAEGEEILAWAALRNLYLTRHPLDGVRMCASSAVPQGGPLWSERTPRAAAIPSRRVRTAPAVDPLRALMTASERTGLIDTLRERQREAEAAWGLSPRYHAVPPPSLPSPPRTPSPGRWEALGKYVRHPSRPHAPPVGLDGGWAPES